MACNNPVKIIKNSLVLFVPCGKCRGCIVDRVSFMTSRADYENMRHARSSFLLLTYDNEHLEFSQLASQFDLGDKNTRSKLLNSAAPLASLRRRHFNQFINSLQKYFRPLGVDFTFFGCGEYGEHGRPHYHLALYGLDWQNCRGVFNHYWSYGLLNSNPVKSGSSRYIMKYLEKQHDLRSFADKYYLERPFITFSKGFGSGLYADHADEIAFDGRVHFGSKLVPVPPYYKNKYIDRDKSLESRERYISKCERSAELSALNENFPDVDSWQSYHSALRENKLCSKARDFGSAAPLAPETYKRGLDYVEYRKVDFGASDALNI